MSGNFMSDEDGTLSVGEEDKLTDWENEPSLADIKNDVTAAESDANMHQSKIDKWLDQLNPRPIEAKEGRSRIVPKLIRKQAEWRYSALTEPFLSTDDLFNAYPKTFEDKERAYQNQIILNHQFNNQLGKVKFIDDYIRTAVNEGTVIVRVGWISEEEEVEVEIPEFDFVPTADPAIAQQMQQMLMAAQQDPNVIAQLPPEQQQALQISAQSGIPHEAKQTGIRTETQTVTTKNQPSLEVCNYKSITIDPSCEGDIEKANFIRFGFETSLSDLEKAGIYINLDDINVTANSVLSVPDTDFADEGQSFQFKDKPRQRFIAYEYWGYWDIDGDGVTKPIIITYVGDTIIRIEENPFPDRKLPFVIVPYLPVRRSIYGEPDGELLEDNQKIMGAVTRGMIDIMARSANGQIGARKDALDVTNRRKFNRGDDYEYNAQVDPRQAFYMHQYPEIPQSAMAMLQLQNEDAESLTGVKAFHSGISGQALGDTATGIRGALDAASKRELGILRRLADGIIQIGRKIISMNAEFLNDEEIIRITNDEFLTVNRDSLAGDFDVKLSISTAEEDNQKVQEQSFMLQTMGNNLPFELTKMILANIAKLRKMPELSKQIEEFQQQPDPIQQKQAELEMMKLEAEIAVERAKVMEMQAQAMLDQAKAESEMAKARHLQSAADKQDLDFVEQESGVTQERDLQKMGEQARSNIALKRMENLYKRESDREKAQVELLKTAAQQQGKQPA